MQNSPDPDDETAPLLDPGADPNVEPASEEEDVPPLTDEKYEARIAPFREHFEQESTRLYGPPDVRQRKSEAYIADLITQYSEPVIRGLLIALSRLESPLCAHWLSEIDLTSTPLMEIIEPFRVGGRDFSVLSADGSDYTVQISISCGSARAGDGGRFVIRRDGNTFTVKDTISEWIY